MSKKFLAGLLTLVFSLALSATVLAHGGGLDQNGGHYDRRTGQYHKHR